MQDMSGKTCVVTGAANGIGLAIAARFAHEGMNLVLADIDEDALCAVEGTLSSTGASVLAVPTDVARAEHIEQLAARATDAFGGVHLLVNNAGVGTSGSIVDSSLDDWRWVMDINLWGIIHAVRAFVPKMLEHAEESHVVNVASISGLIDGPEMGIYRMTKTAVVSLSETLFHEMAQQHANVGVSVVCPGFVKTRIMSSERNRSDAYLEGAPARVPSEAHEEAIWAKLAGSFSVIEPEQVAERVFEAVRDRQLYVLTHPEMSPAITARVERVVGERNPD